MANRLFLVTTALLLVLAIVGRGRSAVAQQDVPRIWTDEAMRDVELPLAAHVPVHHMPADYYYRIPTRPNVKTYPIYAPGREPTGYWEWLQQQDPQPAFDPGAIKTDADWIAAGRLVFEAPKDFNPYDDPFTDVRNPDWYKYTGIRLLPNGELPYYRYVIRKKGVVEVNLDSCAECHTRVMDDGTVLRGAQGNIPFGKIFSYNLAHIPGIPQTAPAKRVLSLFYGAPWIQPDPTAPLSEKTLADVVAHLATIPEGVNPRQGTSATYPAQIPDLIGVKDRLYLDHTGLQQHRSIEDLMRYDAINNFIEEVTDYDGFRPVNGKAELPAVDTLSRESDLELYALARYIYSLQPPANPNRFDDTAARGQRVFQREGCARCHTPPLYTNNMLTPALGFTVPDEDRKKYRVMNTSVGTDPFLATETRRGTGYYKVPSLKGVWYRGPFEHNGSVATLEDWFDPRRLEPDYVPTGYKGYGAAPHAVKGHPFGLDLTPEDKRALIAFLKTL